MILITGMGLLFIVIGLLINKNTASKLLSGYNDLSQNEQEKYDERKFLRDFQIFHFALGLMLIISSWLIYLIWGKEPAYGFVATFPLLAYIVFFSVTGKKKNLIAIIILIVALAGVLISYFF